MESYEQTHSRRIRVRLRQKEEEWQVAIIWPQRVVLFSNSTREAAEVEAQQRLISGGISVIRTAEDGFTLLTDLRFITHQPVAVRRNFLLVD